MLENLNTFLATAESIMAIRETMAGIQSEIGIKRLYQGVEYWSDQIKTYVDAGFDIAGLYAVNPCEPLVEIDCHFRREVER